MMAGTSTHAHAAPFARAVGMSVCCLHKWSCACMCCLCKWSYACVRPALARPGGWGSLIYSFKLTNLSPKELKGSIR